MTQTQLRRPSQEQETTPIKPPVSTTPTATQVTEKTLKAAKILQALANLGDTALLQQTIRRVTGDNTDGKNLFYLQSGMDLQSIVVVLTNAVGYAPLKQAYNTVARRNIDQDFGPQLAAVSATRSGFGLNPADQAHLTGLMLEQNAKKRWVVGNQLLDMTGKVDNMGANLFQGTTRNLAQRPVNLPPAVHKALGKAHGSAVAAVSKAGLLGIIGAGLSSFEGAQLNDIQDPKVIEALITEIQAAKQTGTLEAFLNNFQREKGKSIYSYIGEYIRDPKLRARVLKHLPQPIDHAQLTYDGFLENIAVSMVYDDETGAQLNGTKGGYKDDTRGGDPAALLKYFGYQASNIYAGKWGFEMRVFTPKPGSKYKDVIVAFRGTEGVKIDLSKDGRAGTQDTLIGDFSPAGIGYHQMEQNRAMLDHIIAKYSKHGPLVMTGHSLGGALAQIATVWYKEKTHRVVTFQGANIDEADVKKLQDYNRQYRKMNAIQATHYRVDGDVVPTAGEAALPGTIHYFDADWKLKGETDFNTGIDRVGNRASKGHVMPILAMFIQDLDVPKDQTGLKLIQDKGIKDEQEVTGKAETRVVYGGKYDNRKDPDADPRMQLEAGRDNAAAAVKKYTTITQNLDTTALFTALKARGINIPHVNYKDIYEMELPYNTILSHLEKLVVNAKDYPDFQKKALALLGLSDGKYGTVNLEIDNKDRELGESLGLNPTGKVEITDKTLKEFIPSDRIKDREITSLVKLWGNFR